MIHRKQKDIFDVRGRVQEQACLVQSSYQSP
jgi:hypothetical protein